VKKKEKEKNMMMMILGDDKDDGGGGGERDGRPYYPSSASAVERRKNSSHTHTHTHTPFICPFSSYDMIIISLLFFWMDGHSGTLVLGSGRWLVFFFTSFI
jgi:hypothetical protein